MSKIALGIVLFNPSIERFNHCIESVAKQVKKIYIFDNSTKPIKKNFSNQIIYISESENKGIAYALNQIMNIAKNDGYEWVVTMDQDSILPVGIIKDYEDYIFKNTGLGIVCPQVIDKRRGYMKVKKELEEEFVHECITSASCTSIEAWESVGRFDEWLFIDLVDNEFCKRLYLSGYKILRLNKWVLDQEFGEIIPKSERQQKFWIRISELLKNENIAKFSYKKIVSPFRVYYTNRNIIYVNRKLKNYGTTAYQNYNCNCYVGFLLCFSLPSLLRAQKKGLVLKSIICGIKDGLNKKVMPWHPNIIEEKV